MNTVEPPSNERFRVRFGKARSMRWIGHLDLQTNFERLLRRAGLRVAHTAGFHPRPRMVFASALPLGTSSEVELVDIWIEAAPAPEELLFQLQRASHPDLPIYELQLVEGRQRAVTTLVVSALYHAAPLPPIGGGAAPQPAELQGAVAALLAAAELPRERRGKAYDLRPLILELAVEADAAEEWRLRMRLDAREGRTGRPEELLRALGLEPGEWRVCRSELQLCSPEPPAALQGAATDAAAAVAPLGSGDRDAVEPEPLEAAGT